MKKKSFNIIFSGGGTGGHIYSSLSIANEIKFQYPKINILFVGAKSKMETKKIPKYGFNIKTIWISGFPNSIFSKSFFLLPFKLINSLWNSNKIIKNFYPDIVIGTGGYASGPLVYMAAKKKIPILIQEQNIIPGFTNRILSKYAKKICIGYKESFHFFPFKKTIFTGNPIRKELLNIPNKKKSCLKLGLNQKKIIILSLGGSQGASSINNFWIKNIKKLIKNNIQLIWQIGKQKIQNIKKKIKNFNKNIFLFDFIDDIKTAYGAADIIISRSGALTLSELCLVGKPCILIPSPFSTHNHQVKNANFFFKKKLALVIQDNFLEKDLFNTIIYLLENKFLKKKLSKNIKKLAYINSTKKIVNEIFNIIL